MRTARRGSNNSARGFLMAAGVFMWGLCVPQVVRGEPQTIVVKANTTLEDEAEQSGSEGGEQKRILIQRVERPGSKQAGKAVAWLGVSTEETSESLTSQLGLKSGEGLVISYLVPESPAAKAGLTKNDVLLNFGDQLLVHPAQLRKLVQMHKEGDAINLTIYRGGKKQQISATLGKTVLHDASLEGDLQDLKLQLKAIPSGLHEQLSELHESHPRAVIDRQMVNEELQRSMEQARQAIRNALRHTTNIHLAFGSASKDLEDLARGGVGVDQGATVVVKNLSKSVKSTVRTDDSGTYVIIATPNKRLTVHDQEGTLIFDGPIESAEDQAKVPKEVWGKVKPMLDEMGSSQLDQPETDEKEEGESSLHGCGEYSLQS